jgi:hypothetical protein
MARDYSKIKAMAQEILKCIGEDDEGANPSIPKQKQDIDDGGQDKPLAFLPGDKGDAEEGEKISEKEDETDGSEMKKRKKDSAMAMMGSVLAKKFGK